MKKSLVAAALYVLFFGMVFGATIFSLIMWAEEIELFY